MHASHHFFVQPFWEKSTLPQRAFRGRRATRARPNPWRLLAEQRCKIIWQISPPWPEPWRCYQGLPVTTTPLQSPACSQCTMSKWRPPIKTAWLWKSKSLRPIALGSWKFVCRFQYAMPLSDNFFGPVHYVLPGKKNKHHFRWFAPVKIGTKKSQKIKQKLS